MPEYLYRREDGSTFTIRQRFLDDPLTVDPDTGQKVVRVIQSPGVIFKGSGFYVNDSKDASKKNLSTTAETTSHNGSHGSNGHSAESSNSSSDSKASTSPTSSTSSSSEAAL